MFLRWRAGRWQATLIDWEGCSVLPVGADVALMLYYYFRERLGKSDFRDDWGDVYEQLFQCYTEGVRELPVVMRVDDIRQGCLFMTRRLIRVEISDMLLGKLMLPVQPLPTQPQGKASTCRSSHRLYACAQWLASATAAWEQLPLR